MGERAERDVRKTRSHLSLSLQDGEQGQRVVGGAVTEPDHFSPARPRTSIGWRWEGEEVKLLARGEGDGRAPSALCTAQGLSLSGPLGRRAAGRGLRHPHQAASVRSRVSSRPGSRAPPGPL